MTFRILERLTRALRNENGQVLPWMVFLAGLTFGAAGLTIDLGHAFISYRQLQTSTDAAAMAGAYAMIQPGATTSTVDTVVKNFASVSNGANATPNLPDPTISITYGCLPIAGPIAADCSAAPVNYNVIQVTQRSTIPTYFIKALTLFGLKSVVSLPLSTTATATIASGKNNQVNVAVVVDSTQSMTNNDGKCGTTREKCAMQGVQTLLSYLTPCTAATSKAGATCVTFDSANLFTYPNVPANQVSSDTDCSSGTNPTIMNYSVPTIGATWSDPTGAAATYQITGFSSDWSSNNAQHGSFGTSSTIVNATGGSTGNNCSGLQAIGGVGTYFAAAIYAAQSSLIAEQAANPGSSNVMIVLSDGDANANVSHITGASGKSALVKDPITGMMTYQYGSANSQCHQAIDAANYATANNTTVYTIGYGAGNSGCSTDNSTNGSSTISPCSELQLMSSGYASGDKSHFYSDGTCPSAYSLTDLNGIFKSIATQLSYARLIPNPKAPITGT
jgi:Putative Flp pilus-assembly TadE/G-like